MRPALHKTVGLGAVALATLTIVHAPAARAGDTATTFTLGAGGLAVTVPGTAVLGTVVTGAATVVSNSLGAVRVDDNRGASAASWTATARSSAFTTDDGGPHESIAAGNVVYTTGSPTLSTGTGVDIPAVAPVTLDQDRTVFAHTGLFGSGSSSWAPTVTVTVPSDAVAGTYSGTITHSVA